MTSTRRLLALLVAMALVAAACGDDDDTADGDAATDGEGAEAAADCGTIDFLQPIPESIIFWPLLVGNELGYFAEEGIEVNLLPGGELPETAFVENGDADIASAGGPEVLQAIDAGSDLVVVYDYWNVAAEGIVTLAGGPSSVEEIADGTFGLVTDSDLATISVVFEELGLDPSTANTVVLGESPAILAEALENGDVDAIAGAIIDFIGMQASGLEIVDITPPGFKASPSASFIVTPDTMANNSTCIEGFLRAWAKGTHAGLHNAENTQAIARAAVPEEWEDEAAGVASYDQSVAPHRPVGSDGQYGVVQVDVWQGVAEQLVGTGDLDTQDIDVTAFVDQSLIDGANDWDRSEVEAEIDDWSADG
ncbi:MAG: ABC transporter substrate-binding protein [Acidimicrobiia bacterium]|nr:ABC transporter substrate-binding protein [Acidimicrobiia bacterium]